MISAVGQLNRPKLPDIPGRETFAGHRHALGRVGRWHRAGRQAGGRHRYRGQCIPDRADHRRPGGATSPSSNGPPRGCSPIPTTTTGWARGPCGRSSTCPSTAAGTVSSCSGRPATGAFRPCGSTRTGPTRTVRSAPSTMPRGRCSPSGWPIRSATTTSCWPRWCPNYVCLGKRTLQDNGSWLSALVRDDVDLVTDPIAEITPHGVVGEDGAELPGRRDRLRHGIPCQPLPLAHGDRGPRTAPPWPSSGVTGPLPTWASPFRTSPTCSACTARAPTWRTAEA